jgi:hypothetical protein
MKRFLLIMIISFTSFASLQAQEYNREKRTEKIQSLKIAFITQKLDLTADEAQRFWPVYNRYETEIRQVMTDNKSVGDAIDNEEKVLNVKKKYKPEFIKVIGQPRTNTLFNAEREFRGVLMRQLKNKQGQQNR